MSATRSRSSVSRTASHRGSAPGRLNHGPSMVVLPGGQTSSPKDHAGQTVHGVTMVDAGAQHDDIDPGDSASQAGRSTSVLSSVANRRLEIKTMKAMLSTEMSVAMERQKLELDELKLQQKKQELDLRLQIAKLAAEEDLLGSEVDGARPNSPSGSIRSVSSVAVNADVVTDIRTTNDSQAAVEVSQNSSDHEVQVNLNPMAREWLPEGESGILKLIKDGQTQNNRIIDTIRLPAAQLVSYDGNPLLYWSFIRSFDATVHSSNVDDGAKLTRLIQYCTGKARKVIECCTIMEPTLGYARARDLLKERFGDNFMIAETWLRKITEGKVIKAGEREQLRDFADDLNCCRETLTTMGFTSEISSQSILLKVIEHLPVYLQIRWKRAVRVIRSSDCRNPTIDDVVRFVKEAADEANDPVYGRLAETNRTRAEPDRQGVQVRANRSAALATSVLSNHNAGHSADNNINCLMCAGSHSLFNCQAFKNLSVEERQNLAKSNRLCFNCLRAGHRSNACRLNRVCTVDGCNRKHTRLLHQVSQQVTRNQPSGAEVVPSQNGFANAGCNFTGAGRSRIVLPVVPVVIQATGLDKKIETYALLDSGSTSSFCSKRLMDSLQLTGKNEVLSLTTLETANSVTKAEVVSLHVSDIDRSNVIEISRVYVREKLPIDADNIATLVDVQAWPRLSQLLSHYPQNDAVTIDLLIGQDVPEALMPREVISECAGSPYAVRTLLGWTINGPVSSNIESNKATVSFIQSEVALEKQVEMFWKLEEVSDNRENSLSVNDKQALKIWDDSMQFVDGHYSFDIPFKCSQPNLPNNFPMAKQRLEGLRRRLSKDESLLKAYTNNMDELVRKGYAEKIPEEEIDTADGSVWYLPHHPVFNPNKPDKIRIVFDCAAIYQGVSLNSQVLQGPDLCNKLIGVLLRFRQQPVAIMADVEAMFHQVRVSACHRNYLRYLWWPRGELSNNVESYRMTVHLFGGVWSPSCCSLALRKTAADNKAKYPDDVIEVVERNFYVDDCLKSVKDEAQAVKLIEQLRNLLAAGGFKLTKWISNNRQALASVPEEDRAKEIKGKNLLLDELPVERALGMRWIIQSDLLAYGISIKEKQLTRRGILSTISSLYDPLGFAGPFILPAKKIVQELCRKKVGWDDPLPDDELSSWSRWLSDLPKIGQFTVNRCLIPSDFLEIQLCQLHHFADASRDGYGVVTFIRLVDVSGRIYCSFVISKSRVAPIRQVTIPRLELSAALLAVRVDRMLRKELDLELADSMFWSDSMLVLQYIKNESKRFHVFVENRVSEIRESSAADQWRYVNTTINPADDISRGLTADELLHSKSWLHGPDYLWNDSSEWPTVPTGINEVPESDPEIRRPVNAYASANVSTENSDDVIKRLFKRYSTWYQLKRSVGWVLIAFEWLKCKCRKLPVRDMSSSMTVDEINKAELCIIRYVQRQTFAVELNMLQNANQRDSSARQSRPVSKNSSIYRLEPQLQDDGLLVVGGRLRTHQLVLPQKHKVVDLIIMQYHVTSGHSGKEHVLALIRERYWIIKARSAVRRILKECYECKRRKLEPIQQKMANLPTDRITPGEPPFTFVGVDIFGPFIVKQGRNELKRYGCLFTCLLIRAVHIEIVYSLETDSFLQALQRFICRRGSVRLIRSDNGTNFVGAAKELEKVIRQLDQTKIENYLRQRSIQWVFNPPAASHMGGVWERQIRSVRRLLGALMKEQRLSDESLNTLMCLVESIINSRPLTTVSDDHNDLEPLTPNHLLLLRHTAVVPPGEYAKNDLYSRKRWKQVQYLADVFWRRWTREYLPTLQLRQKWIQPVRNVRIGDVVVLMDDNTPRNTWPLGRVTETFPGSDGLVRSVVVKTKSAVLKRPVHKLCLLEMVDSED